MQIGDEGIAFKERSIKPSSHKEKADHFCQELCIQDGLVVEPLANGNWMTRQGSFNQTEYFKYSLCKVLVTSWAAQEFSRLKGVHH